MWLLRLCNFLLLPSSLSSRLLSPPMHFPPRHSSLSFFSSLFSPSSPHFTFPLPVYPFSSSLPFLLPIFLLPLFFPFLFPTAPTPLLSYCETDMKVKGIKNQVRNMLDGSISPGRGEDHKSMGNYTLK